MTRGLVALAAAFVLSACSHSPVARDHSLFPQLNEGAASTGSPTEATTSVVIVSCSVPEAVDRPQWVVIDRRGELQILPGERWIEPLKRAIPRVVAHEIQRALPEVAAWSATGADAPHADVRIRLDVAAWQATLGQHARVDLVWQIDRGKTSRIARGSFVVPVEDDTHAALLQAQRAALVQASVGITSTVQALLRESRQ